MNQQVPVESTIGASISQDIRNRKYRCHRDGIGESSLAETFARVVRAAASPETQPHIWQAIFETELPDLQFIPPDRILAGAGTGLSVYEKAYALGVKGCTTFRSNLVSGSILIREEDAKTCPSCGSTDLTPREGCFTCQACGFALCG